ncbi:TspO/MBR-related protein [Artemisia annua]|uniref:TspO/MBR-related protein n=1 Tax=Artemisia annua TaxID=35608 RepID=A0A2U1L4Q5_ARTAN|nr:TspO/MBR-related protein [Artemisia annua]
MDSTTQELRHRTKDDSPITSQDDNITNTESKKPQQPWLVWAEGGFHENPAALGSYLAQLGLSLLWDPIFFKMNAAKVGLFVCLAQMATMFNCYRMFGKVNRTAGDLVKLCMYKDAILMFTPVSLMDLYNVYRVDIKYQDFEPNQDGPW